MARRLKPRWIVSGAHDADTALKPESYSADQASSSADAAQRFLRNQDKLKQLGGFVSVVDTETGRERRYRVRPKRPRASAQP
jgi:hypothetical protein